MRSNRALLAWYRAVNKFFEGRLPDNTCVRWVNEEDTDESKFCEKVFGWTQKCDDGYHSYEIVLSKSRCDTLATKLGTLVHECCHVATECRDEHGPAFEYWRQYISDKGIFKKSALKKGWTLF